ncbi:MAG: hypothetical protein JOZ62_22975 [Acidobacteriaceae bacterium]|nr:hypothetical protein [Acidobacteriaceae bacterium]
METGTLVGLRDRAFLGLIRCSGRRCRTLEATILTRATQELGALAAARAGCSSSGTWHAKTPWGPAKPGSRGILLDLILHAFEFLFIAGPRCRLETRQAA